MNVLGAPETDVENSGAVLEVSRLQTMESDGIGRVGIRLDSEGSTGGPGWTQIGGRNQQQDGIYIQLQTITFGYLKYTRSVQKHTEYVS